MLYRIGILGGGNISETHARAAQQLTQVQIVAVCGQNPGKVERLAAAHGAAAYRDIDSFFEHGLDVVLIGSPSGLHAQQAMLAARYGIHALVEKPLDISTDRIDALIAETESRRVQLGVFFQDRAAPAIQWLQQLVASGELGEVSLASARVRWFRPAEYYAASRWRGTWVLDGGGALMNQGIHTIDLLIWLLGDPTRVYASTRAALHAIEVEDTAVACLEFANGALATFEVTTAAYPGYARRLELTGSAGTVILESDRIVSADLREPASRVLPEHVGSTNESDRSATVADVRGHRAVLEDFLHALEHGTRPLCDGYQGRRSVAVVEALYQSARSGEAVSLPVRAAESTAREVIPST